MNEIWSGDIVRRYLLGFALGAVAGSVTMFVGAQHMLNANKALARQLAIEHQKRVECCAAHAAG